MTGFGLSSFIFTFIANFIINPSSEPANKDGFYQPEIARRVYKFIYIEFIIMICLGSVSVIMTFPNHENQTSEYSEVNLNQTEESLMKNKDEQISESEPVTTALKSRMYLLALITVFCSLCKIFKPS